MWVGSVVGGTSVSAPLHAPMKTNMSSAPIQQRWLAKIFFMFTTGFPPLFGQTARFHPRGCHRSGIHSFFVCKIDLWYQVMSTGIASMTSAILSQSSCELYPPFPKKQAPTTSAERASLPHVGHYFSKRSASIGCNTSGKPASRKGGDNCAVIACKRL